MQGGHDATHANFNPNGYRITALTVGRLDRRTGAPAHRRTGAPAHRG
ncbi:hypothetical protein [Micromonospora haikouensis]|nr:hypothetical protein [Micromonospora haikouensis]